MRLLWTVSPVPSFLTSSGQAVRSPTDTAKSLRKIRFFSFVIAFALLLNVFLLLPSVCAEEPPLSLSVSAQAAILIDADTGRVLYAKDAEHQLPMASTTKIMTALVAAASDVPTRVIRVDAGAVGIEGSSVYLYEGEELTLEQLLYAMLLESANDAAAAIAIAIGGSIDAFADAMNAKAKELGLQHTHFANPHGLDNEEHYTTAHDLALIARAAIADPVLGKIFATRKTTIPLNNTQGVRLLLNHNKLLRLYDGAIGVKTGYTKRSGRCLVSAARRDGLTLIAVTLNAPDDWSDHTRMLDAGFSAFTRVTLCETGDSPQAFRSMVPVTGGMEGYVLVHNTASLSLTLPRAHGSITCTVELPSFLYAPVSAEAVIGHLLFYCDLDGDGNREEIGRVPLTAVFSVERDPPKSLWHRLGAWFRALFS